MAVPVLKLGSANEKLLPLIDSTITTSTTRVPVSLTKTNQSVGGDVNWPPGWMGVATHNQGDTLATPGGFTIAAGNYPILVAGGASRDTLAQASRKTNPLALGQGGAAYTLPGPTFTDADPAVYVQPLAAAGGSVLVVGNAVTNLAATTTLASNFGYITDLLVICQVVGVGAQTFVLDDGATARWGFNTVAQAVGFTLAIQFSNPLRSTLAATAFRITTTGTGSTWSFSCNGFFSIF